MQFIIVRVVKMQVFLFWYGTVPELADRAFMFFVLFTISRNYGGTTFFRGDHIFYYISLLLAFYLCLCPY